jgi:copper chaperone CopZ
MHCDGCSQKIEKSLSKTKGIRNVHADFENKQVILEYDKGKIDLEKIRSTIKKAGFIPGVEQ